MWAHWRARCSSQQCEYVDGWTDSEWVCGEKVSYHSSSRVRYCEKCPGTRIGRSFHTEQYYTPTGKFADSSFIKSPLPTLQEPNDFCSSRLPHGFSVSSQLFELLPVGICYWSWTLIWKIILIQEGLRWWRCYQSHWLASAFVCSSRFEGKMPSAYSRCM